MNGMSLSRTPVMAVNALQRAQLGRSRCSQSPHPAAVLLSLPQSVGRVLVARIQRSGGDEGVVGVGEEDAGGLGGVQSEVEQRSPVTAIRSTSEPAAAFLPPPNSA